MNTKTFDSKCLELAEHFLSGSPNVTDDEKRRLAIAIQTAVEDWIEEENLK